MAFTKLEPTGVNTSATFTFSNVVVTGTTNLGAVGNITITGGTAGYVLSTDGSGSLSWVAQSGGGGGGSPGGSNRYVQFNDSGTFGGVSALQFDKATNTLTLNGNLTSNNANLGNLVTANYFTGTLINGNQPNITTVGALSGLTLLGNIIPSANNQFTIGNSSFRFKDLFLSGTSIFIGDQTISSDSGGIGFTGNITSTNANLGNLVTSNYYTGNGTLLSYLNASNIGSGTIPSGILGNSTVYLGTTGIALNRTSGSQSLTGITSIDGYASTVSTNAQPNITSVGTLASVDVTGNVSTGGNLIGNGYYLSSLNGSNITGTVSTATTAGTVTTNAQPNITSVGTLSSVSVTANVSAGNVLTDNLLYANGVAWSLGGGGTNYSNSNVATFLASFGSNTIITTGNITSGNIIGNGQALTGLNASNIASGTIPSGILGNSTVYVGTTGIALNRGSASQSLTGITSIDGYAATVSANAQPNITSVGTLASLSVTANVSAGNLKTDNLLYANGVAWSFGSGGTNYSNSNVASFLANFGSNTISTTGNISAGNANISGTFTVGSGTSGTISGANLVSANYFTGTLTTGVQPNITSIGTLTSANITGNVSSGGNIIGNGQYLTSITGANVTGTVSSATTAGTVTTNAQPNITSVGTLASLTVSGLLTATGGGVKTGNIIDSTGTNTISVSSTTVGVIGNLSVGTGGTGWVSASNFSGSGNTLTNLNASNIASGTIPSAILGNSTVYIGTTGIALNRASASQSLTGITSIDGYATTVSTAAQPNITSLGTLASVTYQANANITMSGTLSQISGANLVNATYITGTLTTAAQPNITSTGTLSSVTVTGNVTAGNIKTNSLLYANGVAWSFGGGTPGGSNTYVQFNDGGSFGGTSGLIFDKGTNKLTASGNISGSILISTNSVGDEGGEVQLALAQTNTTLTGGVTIDVYQNRVRIFETGGTARGAFIDLSAATAGVGSNLLAGGAVSSISNGTSNVNIAASGGNVTVGVGGTAGVVTVTSAGMNVTGLNVSGYSSFYASQDKFAAISGATGIVTHDVSTGAVFYHTSVAANFTPNFTNVNSTDGFITVLSLLIAQGATAYMPTATANVQIGGSNVTVKWAAGSSPGGVASTTQIVSYSLLRSSGAWTVFGQSSYFS